ncbi:MAG: hypothetical protein Athens101410_376 [Parcubacteria group bacterium Athens1014_10]|nr:MAG: hypothetical protein Athens101410_376 [Parcubacteria group bacterium Athens1014_10]TSD05126.1 MAG: hypothetical protein Athens071412_495 [Parcubacteria group bacterium Athens0714_12]
MELILIWEWIKVRIGAVKIYLKRKAIETAAEINKFLPGMKFFPAIKEKIKKVGLVKIYFTAAIVLFISLFLVVGEKVFFWGIVFMVLTLIILSQLIRTFSEKKVEDGKTKYENSMLVKINLCVVASSLFFITFFILQEKGGVDWLKEMMPMFNSSVIERPLITAIRNEEKKELLRAASPAVLVVIGIIIFYAIKYGIKKKERKKN